MSHYRNREQAVVAASGDDAVIERNRSKHYGLRSLIHRFAEHPTVSLIHTHNFALEKLDSVLREFGRVVEGHRGVVIRLTERAEDAGRVLVIRLWVDHNDLMTANISF